MIALKTLAAIAVVVLLAALLIWLMDFLIDD